MSVFRKHGLVHKRTAWFHLLFDQVKLVNLKPVTRVQYKFDPFYPKTREFRDFMFYFSSPTIRDTNLNCTFKTEVVCDNSEPQIVCKLIDGKVLNVKAGNLTAYEILKEFNQIVLPLVPPPEDLTATVIKTKSQKKK